MLLKLQDILITSLWNTSILFLFAWSLDSFIQPFGNGVDDSNSANAGVYWD